MHWRKTKHKRNGCETISATASTSLREHYLSEGQVRNVTVDTTNIQEYPRPSTAYLPTAKVLHLQKLPTTYLANKSKSVKNSARLTILKFSKKTQMFELMEIL